MRKSLFDVMNDMVNDMTTLIPYERTTPNVGFSLFPTNLPASFMRTDIVEKEDKYLVHVDLPGFKKEEINVSLEDNVLEISAQKSSEEKSEDGSYIRRERYSGQQTRTLRIPEGTKEEDIKASFEDGVLQIEVPNVVEGKVEKKSIAIE